MKLTVYDNQEVTNPLEQERVQFILEALGSLDQFDTLYAVYGQDDLPAAVAAYILEEGPTVLPLTYVDEHLKKTKSYPSNEDFMTYTGIEFDIQTEEEYEAHGHDHEHDHAHHHHDHEGGCSCGHHH